MNEKMRAVTVRFKVEGQPMELDKVERHAHECPIEHTWKEVTSLLRGPLAEELVWQTSSHDIHWKAQFNDRVVCFYYTHLFQEEAEKVVRHWDKRFEEVTVMVGDHDELWPTPDEDLEKSYMAE